MPHITDELQPPSYWADRDPEGRYDCSVWIGELGSDAPWAMYSYSRPGNILWNAIAGELYRRGWSDDEIKAWLQSKTPRYELDGALGEAIESLGRLVARSAVKENNDAHLSL